MIMILSHTPIWVYALFAGLLLLGWQQSRTREVKPWLAFLMPAGLLGYSLSSVLLSVDLTSVWSALACWLLGLFSAIGVGFYTGSKGAVAYSVSTGRLLIQGSWLPLVFIQGIFWVKYSVGVLTAMTPELLTSTVAVYSLSFVYGLFGGVFTARTLFLWMAYSKGKAESDIVE